MRCLFGRAETEARTVLPVEQAGEAVPAEVMADIYETIKTPFKYGVVLKGEPGKMVESPSVFRHGAKWYMLYIIFDGRGYETAFAESEDLLIWNAGSSGQRNTRTKPFS
jgi:hypothetical protein